MQCVVYDRNVITGECNGHSPVRQPAVFFKTFIGCGA